MPVWFTHRIDTNEGISLLEDKYGIVLIVYLLIF